MDIDLELNMEQFVLYSAIQNGYYFISIIAILGNPSLSHHHVKW